MTHNNRCIRVFVSSTFQDMKVERDHLVKVIFPQLRKLCESRSVVWGEVDLRWGITDEEQAEGKILPVCLHEIDRCRPYFIGLLGERYGWVPEQIPDDLVERQPWLREQRARSVTELEMLHGILRHETVRGQGFFYFRDPGYLDRLPSGSNRAEFESESPEAQANLSALKHRLREAQVHGLCGVREPYPDHKTLGDWILEDFTALINERFPEGSQLDPLDRDALDHEAFAQSRAKVYIGRQAYFDRLEAHVAGNDPPLVVLGESGSGKSALLANWFLRYQQAHPETLTLIHFIAATPYSADWAAMLRRILGEFKRRFDIREEIPSDPNALRSTFANWLHRAAAKCRVVLMLDALNQLEDRDGAPDLVWLPPVVPPNVRMIVSTLPGRALDNLITRGWPTLTVNPLEEPERNTLIVEYLAQYTKSLSPARVTHIATADQTANPLYLRILLDELRLHGVHETLESTIEHYLAAPSISELYGKVLARWEQDYEGETDLVGDALSLLWAARHGLFETEWRELLGTDGQPLPQAILAPFLLAVESGLVNRAGLVTFAHDYLRTAVQEAYVPAQRHQRVAHRRLADYFSAQPLTSRHLDERPWQLAEAGDWQPLAELLGEEDFFVSAWRANRYEVRRFWVSVEQHLSERISHTYRRTVIEPLMQGRRIPHAGDVAILLDSAGHHAEAAQIYKVLIGCSMESKDLVSLGVWLGNYGLILNVQGDLDGAMIVFKQEERIWRELGIVGGLQRALGSQASVLRARGDLDGAMLLYKGQEQVYRELGDQDGLARSLGNQGGILQAWGDLDRAMLLYKEQEQLSQMVGDPVVLARALGAQAGVLHTQGDLDGAMLLYKGQEQVYRELGDQDGLARSLGNQALFFRARGNHSGAMLLHKEQEQLSRKTGDLIELANSLGSQGEILYSQGDLDGAMLLHKEQEQLSRKMGEVHELTLSLGGQAMILKDWGDLDGAMLLHKEQERVCREWGNLDRLQASLGLQADILLLQGDLDGAMLLNKEQEQLCRKAGNPVKLAAAFGTQALIFQMQGDLDRAMMLHKDGERIFREIGHLEGLAASAGNQGLILNEWGDLDGAILMYKEQERLCREMGNSDGIARSLGNQAGILYARGDLGSAMLLYKESERLFRELGHPEGLQAALGNQGAILYACGDLDGAIILLKEQERLCREIGSPYGLVNSCANQARISAQQGNLTDGRQLAQEAYHLAMQHGLTAVAQQIAPILRQLGGAI